MARLMLESLRPEGVDRKDGDEYWLRAGALIEELTKKSWRATESDPTGFLMEFPVDDGFASYVVVAVRPLTLQHVDVMNGYRMPEAHIRGLTLSDVRRAIRSRSERGPKGAHGKPGNDRDAENEEARVPDPPPIPTTTLLKITMRRNQHEDRRSEPKGRDR